MNEHPYWFDYHIKLEDGQSTRFHIELDPDTLTMVPSSSEPYPPWTQLSYKQCQRCPLSPKTNLYCPIAVNITELVDRFKDILSHKNCMVICETVDRTYSKKTSAMDGLTSVFGIVMATSNCPVMNFLKPMARFHLPFASVEETTARSTSLFLLGQYFEYKKGRVKSFDFDKLENLCVQMENEMYDAQAFADADIEIRMCDSLNSSLAEPRPCWRSRYSSSSRGVTLMRPITSRCRS